MKAHNSFPVVTWLCLTTALLLPFYRLDYSQFWHDELLSVLISRKDWSVIFSGLWDPLNQPFFYALVKLWDAVVVGDSIFWLRFPIALAHSLTILLLYKTTKRLWGASAALWLALIASLSAILLNHAQELRPYALANLIFVASVFWIVTFFQKPASQSRFAGFQFVSGLIGLLALWYFLHRTGLAFGWLLLLSALAIAMGEGKRTHAKWIGVSLGFYCCFNLLILSDILGTIEYLRANPQVQYHINTDNVLLHRVYRLFKTSIVELPVTALGEGFISAYILLLCVLTGITVYRLRSARSQLLQFAVLALWSFLPLILAMLLYFTDGNVFRWRYALPSIVVFYGFIVFIHCQAIKQPWWRNLCLTGLCAVLVINIFHQRGYYEVNREQRGKISGMVDTLLEWDQEPLILSYSHMYADILEFHLRKRPNSYQIIKKRDGTEAARLIAGTLDLAAKPDAVIGVYRISTRAAALEWLMPLQTRYRQAHFYDGENIFMSHYVK